MSKRSHYSCSEGCIYFVGCPDPVAFKVGFTTRTPHERLKQLQTGNPMPLVLVGWYPGTVEDERQLHARLAEFRLQGEWFRLDPAMSDALRGPVLLMRINNHLTGHSVEFGEDL